MTRIFALALCVILAGCTTQPTRTPAVSDRATTTESMNNAYREFVARNPLRALPYLDDVIAQCKPMYESTNPKYYAARSPTEVVAYMTLAATNKTPAEAIGEDCAEALYLKGYIHIDLGQLAIAQDNLQRAADLSPLNSKYLSELGHIQQLGGQWALALGIFEQAEKGAAFSPEKFRQTELLRAKRGVGFSLIELGRLDEADAKFKECLRIDPNDRKAMNEILYIEKIRTTKTAP